MGGLLHLVQRGGRNAVLAGVHDIHLRQLQGVLNAAARLIVCRRKYDSISSTMRGSPSLAANPPTYRV